VGVGSRVGVTVMVAVTTGTVGSTAFGVLVGATVCPAQPAARITIMRIENIKDRDFGFACIIFSET
jgi:hypothetical protein